MKLVPAHASDLENLREWVPDAEACTRWTGPLFPFPLPEMLYESLHTRGEKSFSLLSENNTVVGLGQIVQRGDRWMHLARIIVDPAERGKGHGKTLVNLLFERALAPADVEQVTLHVLRRNAPAVHIYKQLGFRELDYNPGDLDPEESAFLTYIVTE